MLSFVPPDGNFRVMSYHISSQKYVPSHVWVHFDTHSLNDVFRMVKSLMFLLDNSAFGSDCYLMLLCYQGIRKLSKSVFQINSPITKHISALDSSINYATLNQ